METIITFLANVKGVDNTYDTPYKTNVLPDVKEI